MKRVFLAVLVIVILFAYSATADSFDGLWSVWLPNSITFGSGNVSMVLQLNEDKTMVFMLTTNLYSDHTITAETFTGTWEENDQGIMAFPETNPNGYQFAFENDLLWVKIGEMEVALRKTAPITIDQVQFGETK